MTQTRWTVQLRPEWQHWGCTEGVDWGNAVNCKTSQCTSHIAAIPHKRHHSLHHAPRNYHHTRVLYPPHYTLITPPLGTPHTTHTSQHPHPMSDLKVILCPLCIVLPSPLTHSLQHAHTSAWQSSSTVNLHKVMMMLSMMLMRSRGQ